VLIDHLNLEVLRAHLRAGDDKELARQLERGLWPAVRRELMTAADLEAWTGAKPGLSALWRHRDRQRQPGNKHNLPEPIIRTPHMTFWKRDDLAAWAKRTGRQWTEPPNEEDDE
jgi:hypothetical protein